MAYAEVKIEALKPCLVFQRGWAQAGRSCWLRGPSATNVICSELPCPTDPTRHAPCSLLSGSVPGAACASLGGSGSSLRRRVPGAGGCGIFLKQKYPCIDCPAAVTTPHPHSEAGLQSPLVECGLRKEMTFQVVRVWSQVLGSSLHQ